MKKIIETLKGLAEKIPPGLKRIIDQFITIVIYLFVFAVLIGLCTLIFALFQRLPFLPWIIMGLTALCILILFFSKKERTKYRMVCLLLVILVLWGIALSSEISILLPSLFLFFSCFVLGLSKEDVKKYFKYSRRNLGRRQKRC